MTTKKTHSKETIRLDKIPKTRVFSTPEDYFDRLPAIIQAKAIESTAKKGFFANLSVFYRLAVPALLIVLALFYVGLRPSNDNNDVQAMLDEVSTSELIAFLNDSEMSTDELLNIVNIEEIGIEAMFDEDIQLLDDSELEYILEEFEDFDLTEFENEI